MKKVVITGGNKGIGLEIAKLFIKKSYRVIVIARDFSSFKLNNKNLEKVKFDLSETNKISQLANKIGDVDVLINNAGIMNTLPYNDYPDKEKDRLMKINIEAPVALIREFSKGMIRKGKGRIVSTASIAGHIGHPDIWYGVSKAGVINITKSFAKLLGPKGIVINCVAPGPVNTEMLRTKIPRDRVEGMIKASFLSRIAKPEEIANTIYWLATESPEYINGICIDVNNGAFLR